MTNRYEGKKYERCGSVDMALSHIAMLEALAQCGFHLPTLYVGRDQVSLAIHIQERYMVNWDIDSELRPGEWYVEWHGSKAGSDPF